MTYCPLDLVESYLRRFVAYPHEHAVAAHTLWIAHTHLFGCASTTPRLAFMSAEPESGKTRALEVSELLVNEPLMGFSMSPAVLIRLVSIRPRGVLYDEIDAVYGSKKSQDDNSDLVAFMNAGYRRGAKSYRCATGKNSKHEPEEFDAFAPIALSGLRDLPRALATRSLIIRMRRRAPGEKIEDFTFEDNAHEAVPIKEALEQWCAQHEPNIERKPALPDGVRDRAADMWRPLLAIADVAGGDWPDRGRDAAVYFTQANAQDEAKSYGVELLEHIRDAFGETDKLHTMTLLDRIISREESPWADIRGKPLDSRGLATRLRPYGIKSREVRIGERVSKGYYAADFHDDWNRYLLLSATRATRATNLNNKNNFVADVADVAANTERRGADYEERAAILEYEGGLTRAEAEAQAAEEYPELPDFLDRRQKAS